MCFVDNDNFGSLGKRIKGDNEGLSLSLKGVNKSAVVFAV